MGTCLFKFHHRLTKDFTIYEVKTCLAKEIRYFAFVPIIEININ